MLTDTECRVSNAGYACPSFHFTVQHQALTVYIKKALSERKNIFSIHMHQLISKRFKLRRPPSHSDLDLKCIDKGAALTGRRQAVGSNALYTYTQTNAHRSTWKRRQSASEILHPTQGQVAEVGVCVVEDPVLPGSPRTRRVSQWKSTAAKRSDPEKGPVRTVTALLFSSSISEFPSCLPALSSREQETGM